MRFVELPYVLATEEAERIGVDHVARVSTSDSGELSSGMIFFFFIPGYLIFSATYLVQQ